MAATGIKRGRDEQGVRRPKKKIRVKKQKSYHSSSEDESEDGEVDVDMQNAEESGLKSILKHAPLAKGLQGTEVSDDDSNIDGLEELDEADKNAVLNTINHADDDGEDESEGDSDLEDLEILADEMIDSDAEELDDDILEDDEDDEDGLSEATSLTSSQAATAKRKRNDPSAFASSISKILDTKLTTSKRSDPVLSRSKAASEANKDLLDSKLDNAARSQIRAERRKALDKGRVTDLLGLQDTSVDTGRMLEEEKRLKKVAQRGVVKLFNAVRAAQVGAEQAAREGGDGVVGRQAKEERVSEMSKEGFLQMISRGKSTTAA